MQIKTTIAMMISITLLFSCATERIKGRTEKINFSLYQGTWYEIARLPNSFEDGLKCISATYSYNEEGMLLLTNKGVNKNNPEDIKTLSGRAWIPDPEHPEKLKVQFVWPVTTDYWLVHIDNDKGYALIGTPSRKHLWFLSRSDSIPQPDMMELIRIAAKNEFRTEGLIFVEHSCGK